MGKDAIFVEVKSSLLNAVSVTGHLKDSDVTLDADLCYDLGLDSLDRIHLGLELEERFNIDLSDDEMEAWWTVEDIVDTLASKI